MIESLIKAVEVATPAMSVAPWTIIGRVLLAAGFGAALYRIYTYYYHKNEPQDLSLARCLCLVCPVLTFVFFLIQTNLALSFGLMGSLSVIRFRTSVKRAEDIAFLLFAIGTSLAAALGNISAGILLIMVIAVFALLRRHWHRFQTEGAAVLTLNTQQPLRPEEVRSALDDVGIEAGFVSSRSYDDIHSLVFHVDAVGDHRHAVIYRVLAELDDQAQIHLFVPRDGLAA